MKSVKEQKRQLNLDKQQQLSDLQKVMATKEGRRFVWRLLDEANIFRSCFTGNSQTFYLEGRREFMLPFYQDIMNACPEQFYLAQRENIKQEENNDSPDDTSDSSSD